MRAADGVRLRVSQLAARVFFEGLSSIGRLHPASRPEAHDVEVLRDIPYLASGHALHKLDLYRPRQRRAALPVVLYIHGGGFQLLSKDTHWMMGLVFARAGYLVVNISYRLAPDDPFPAALSDCTDALAWLAEHAAEYGGDPRQLVFAGESAGANLACSLAIVTCYRRPEPFAERAFALGLVPRVVVLGCGILQVSDPLRFGRRRSFPRWIQTLIRDISEAYVPHAHELAELADPLLLLERAQPPERALPAVFAFVGTRDPVLDDTRRLDRALVALGVRHETHFYPGELHAFHALMLRRAARECWRDKLAFVARELERAA
jgi:acetyl esterase